MDLERTKILSGEMIQPEWSAQTIGGGNFMSVLELLPFQRAIDQDDGVKAWSSKQMVRKGYSRPLPLLLLKKRTIRHYACVVVDLPDRDHQIWSS
jgi:hypothetical protein